MQSLRIINVVGARPNFMKIAPLMRAMAEVEHIRPRLVHTGQHYDHAMSKLFFDELGLPPPDIDLGIGSGSAGEQLGKTMIEFEKVLVEEKPDVVVVVGDVNATLACGLMAVRHGVKLAHVEAGLRSFDRTMPEEVNRILTDQISDLLFITEPSARKNLLSEGVAPEKIIFTGNVMIDTLQSHIRRAELSTILETLAVTSRQYGLVTLHRPTNVDEVESLREIIGVLGEIQNMLPLIFPMHPRTRKQLERFDLNKQMETMTELRLVEPLGYFDFLKLMAYAQFVLTDSGGIQEETTALGVPCITVRDNTERPITVEVGTNEITGNDRTRILDAVKRVLAGRWKKGALPELWDGKAASRIVDEILWSFSPR